MATTVFHQGTSIDGVSLCRKLLREVVDRSYNATVPVLLEKYPKIFAAQMLIPEKWAWACR